MENYIQFYARYFINSLKLIFLSKKYVYRCEVCTVNSVEMSDFLWQLEKVFTIQKLIKIVKMVNSELSLPHKLCQCLIFCGNGIKVQSAHEVEQQFKNS